MVAAGRSFKNILYILLPVIGLAAALLALLTTKFDLRSLASMGNDEESELANIPIDRWKKYPYSKGKISFPSDEGAHPNYNTEWWYLNFNNADYAGFLTVIRMNIPAAEIKSALIAGLTDKKSKTYTSRVVTGDLTSRQGKLDLRFSGADEKGKYNLTWKNVDNSPFIYELKVQTPFPGAGGTFRLDSAKPPLTEGEDGIVPIGNGIDSYYYSLTRINASNTTYPGDGRAVAWMDHQWFNANYSGGGVLPKPNHEWFSVQAKNSDGKLLDLVFWRIFSGGELKYLGIVFDGGRQNDSYAVSVTPTEFWTSPGGVKYAKSWKVENKSRPKISGVVRTAADNQLVETPLGNFYEGAATFSGMINGKRARGDGFAELTHTY